MQFKMSRFGCSSDDSPLEVPKPPKSGIPLHENPHSHPTPHSVKPIETLHIGAPQQIRPQPILGKKFGHVPAGFALPDPSRKLRHPEVEATNVNLPKHVTPSKIPSEKKNVGPGLPPKSGPRDENRSHPHSSQDLKTVNLDNESTRTPRASALDFWAEADASLAPPESASALPPNREGEPPPDIWKDVDNTLNARKGGTTLQEWIASLPGSGLKLAPWAADGTLDSKTLGELKKDIELAKDNEAKSDGEEGEIRARTIERVKNVAEPTPLKAKIEEFVPDEEDDLQGIGEAVDSSFEEEIEGFVPEDFCRLPGEETRNMEDAFSPEPTPDNGPPPVADPTLLHPEYQSSSSSNAPNQTISSPEYNSRQNMVSVVSCPIGKSWYSLGKAA
ncbi:hypothetical protein L873DRAFT_1915320 [Choiromyces venosus 120613-1]|uniref:Uncharacterized protein n=1 Tax=Choiromyces venosus 120613-1 TaxID=1336337 RepID=A0A3N4JLY0_9PEZI|nr:hypothetical protein L873DRAFT_1915320 [Choiromyces venosus 120613-1]